jgi:predicted metal-dependent hydrolase
VQLRLPWVDSDAESADAILFVRHRRARRYIIRVLPGGVVRVTLPRWGGRRDARAFVHASRDWIARQRARQANAAAASKPWGHGTTVLVGGRDAVIAVAGDSRVTIHGEGEAVELDGPATNVRRSVEAWLRARAARELPARLRALAAQHGIDVPRISIRNQRSRWGACSPTGTITLNWRLLQVPAFVCEYVLLHELMHRRELNHSPRFWRLVAASCPCHTEAREWLRTEGKHLWSDCECS